MGKPNERLLARERRHARVRGRVVGTPQRPRLNVFRSLNHIYAQIVDDSDGHTLVVASSIDAAARERMAGKNKTQQAAQVGQLLAERAVQLGIQQVVFDRAGYQYHGRVKALAEASREHGLKF
jgi:large subunit ribosomal protein L18